MKSSIMNKTILAVAILTMAAFAGVMIVGDEADADPVAITYMVDTESTTRSMTGVTFVAPTPADIGFDIGDNVFLNWAAGANLADAKASGAVYRAGMEYAVPSSPMTLWAIFDNNTYVTLVVGEESFKCIVNAGQIKTDSVQYKAAVAAVDAIDSDKFRLKGWFVKDAVSAEYADLKKIAEATDLTDSITLTLKTTAYYQISFIVEGVQIMSLASDELADKDGKYVIPVAPTKENYVFAAWTDKDGAEIITYVEGIGYKPVASELKFTADTALYAKFVPNNMTVTFQVGEFSSTQTVLYGAKAMKPVLPEGYVAWMLGEEEFNFDTPITENITLTAKAGEVAQIYTITFEIVDKAPVIQKSDSMVIPDTAREGYMFQGWVVKGESQYVDPAELVKTITADTTFVAVYKAVEVVEYTVTFVNGDEVVDTVEVVKDALVDEIDAPEGMFWLFDFETPITGDVTIEAKPLTVTVQFAVGEKVYNAYTQTVAYGEKIDITKLADFIFPDGFDSWGYDFNEPVTADMTVYAKAIPAPEKEPAFYQTPMGQCAIILAVFVVGLVFYGIFTGRITVPKFKISRAEKIEAPVEQPQEEKKP